MSGTQNPYRYTYETVAPSQTAQVLGGTGAVGDYLHRVIVNVTTALTGTVTLLDGATSIALVSANVPIGTYSLAINAASQNGAWKITTGAGCNVIAVGVFSA